MADHPRSRGVYPDMTNATFLFPGSSPLARGLPRYFKYDKDDARIIPARAGFTGPRISPTWWPGDHPRSRGVYASAESTDPEPVGSSPLARGLPLLEPGRGEPARIIPARAGFTCASHPRPWTR